MVESYRSRQQRAGFKVGDKVIITRKAATKENGWSNSWVKDMDFYLNKEGTITEISGEVGIRVYFTNKATWQFPYFVLQKINQSFLDL